MELKYVVIANAYPVVFSPSISHDRMQDLGRITSAGFVTFTGGAATIYGESVTLKLSPDPFDKTLLEVYFNHEEDRNG